MKVCTPFWSVTFVHLPPGVKVLAVMVWPSASELKFRTPPL
jgi:hypothetical protein